MGQPGWPMLGWLLAALAALAPGGAAAAPSFSCWKQCRSAWIFCSWPPLGPAGNTSYVLTLCYATPRPCQRFKVGTRTTYSVHRHRVYILTNATAWVEAHWGDQVHRTPNLTLYLDKAVKLEPPPTGMPFAKTSGRLRLRVPRPSCQHGDQPPQREARFRRTGNHSWTQVMCEAVTDDDDSVICPLGRNGTFEVQLRHKLPHWSSYWSNWSSSIFVPEEILVSPALTHQLGKLGRDGQRVLRLSWQRAPKEQGDVNYTLRAHMPACRCAEEDAVVAEEDAVVPGREVTEHNLTLSGAEYEILVTAANAAGPGPPWQLRVPAAQPADLSFKDILVTGGTVTARWEAPTSGSVYCFEQQPLLGDPKQGICVQEAFPGKSIHVETGALEAPACFRLAVHGWAQERGWATFALQHRYAGNTSLAVPFHINASAGDAAAIVLQWSPSPRAACPGMLVKYLICYAAEGDNVTYDEAEPAASYYTLQNLRPGTLYRVGIQEVMAESGETCSPWRRIQTKALGPQGAVWKSYLKYLGISLGLPTMAAIYQLSKKRACRILFPPLPKPVGSKAIQFSSGEMSQGQPRPGFLEPSERFSPAELLLPDPNPSMEKTDTGTQPPSIPQPGPAAEERVVVCPLGCQKELPFTYRRQEVLSPVGLPPPGSTSCTSHPPSEEKEEDEEEEEVGGRGLCQPLVPIALLISDKPVIIRDEDGWDPSLEKTLP